MKLPTIITSFGLIAGGFILGSQSTAHADFPPVPDGKIPSLAVHLTCHYIEHLVEKPKTNKELLMEYVIAYKNMERTITAASNENDYSIKVLPEAEPPKK